MVTFGKSSAQKVNKIAATGRATALRLAGRLDDSEKTFREVLQEFPNNAVALCGVAEAARLQGRYKTAIAAYEIAADRSPYNTTPLVGRAMTLVEMRQYGKALSVLDDALARFPGDIAAELAIIKVLQRLGRYEDALRRVDALLWHQPHSISAKISRARILEAMGQSEDALLALDLLTNQHAFSAAAHIAKASILVAMGHFDKASLLLHDSKPKTQADWSRFLLLMISKHYIDNGSVSAKRIAGAVKHCPFYIQRRAMRNTLVIFELEQRRYRVARNIVEDAPDETSDIIALHAYAASNRTAKARQIFNRIKDTELDTQVITLADEIARRAGLIVVSKRKTMDWVEKAEKSLVLLDVA